MFYFKDISLNQTNTKVCKEQSEELDGDKVGDKRSDCADRVFVVLLRDAAGQAGPGRRTVMS